MRLAAGPRSHRPSASVSIYMETLASEAWRWFVALWPHLTAAAILALNLGASVHAILVKRDTRSTIGWVGLIWLSPVFGAIAYAVLGVNRIRSRAPARG